MSDQEPKPLDPGLAAFVAMAFRDVMAMDHFEREIIEDWHDAMIRERDRRDREEQ